MEHDKKKETETPKKRDFKHTEMQVMLVSRCFISVIACNSIKNLLIFHQINMTIIDSKQLNQIS